MIRLAAGGPVETVRLEVEESGPDVHYTAISHLWRDGLGNVGSNALPKCQILRLNRLVEHLNSSLKPISRLENSAESCSSSNTPTTVRFWIDTLCVPIKKELKSLALSFMHRTYKDAQWVLVLDADLEEASCHNSADVENVMRIFTSGWMGRLWTYEECILAKDGALYVQFHDGVISLNTTDLLAMSDSHQEEWRNLYQGIITQDFLAHLILLRALSSVTFPNELGERRRIGTIWNTIRGRTATKLGDEPIVLAALLGLDAGEVHKASVSDRMRKLFSLRAEWPCEFIFADGQRLRAPGYQWAPSSLLSAVTAGAPNNPVDVGVRTDDGLVIVSDGFVLLETPATTVMTPYVLFEVESKCWSILAHNDEEPYDPSDTPAWDTVSPRKGVTSGIILGENGRHPDKQWALLLTITKEDGGILYGTFGCRMLISYCENQKIIEAAERNAPWKRVEKENEERRIGNKKEFMPIEEAVRLFGRMRRRGHEQMWCHG